MVKGGGSRPATQHAAREDPGPASRPESAASGELARAAAGEGKVARAAPAALPAAARRPGAGPGTRRPASASAHTARPQRAAPAGHPPRAAAGCSPALPRALRPTPVPRGGTSRRRAGHVPRASPDPDGRCGPRRPLRASRPGRRLVLGLMSVIAIPAIGSNFHRGIYLLIFSLVVGIAACWFGITAMRRRARAHHAPARGGGRDRDRCHRIPVQRAAAGRVCGVLAPAQRLLPVLAEREHAERAASLPGPAQPVGGHQRAAAGSAQRPTRLAGCRSPRPPPHYGSFPPAPSALPPHYGSEEGPCAADARRPGESSSSIPAHGSR